MKRNDQKKQKAFEQSSCMIDRLMNFKGEQQQQQNALEQYTIMAHKSHLKIKY